MMFLLFTKNTKADIQAMTSETLRAWFNNYAEEHALPQFRVITNGSRWKRERALYRSLDVAALREKARLAIESQYTERSSLRRITDLFSSGGLSRMIEFYHDVMDSHVDRLDDFFKEENPSDAMVQELEHSEVRLDSVLGGWNSPVNFHDFPGLAHLATAFNRDQDIIMFSDGRQGRTLLSHGINTKRHLRLSLPYANVKSLLLHNVFLKIYELNLTWEYKTMTPIIQEMLGPTGRLYRIGYNNATSYRVVDVYSSNAIAPHCKTSPEGFIWSQFKYLKENK